MKILIASDHGAYELKSNIKKYLEKKYKVEDLGSDSTDSVDYPDYAEKLIKQIQGTQNLGILLCGTGIGMCITANKFKGIQAALIYDKYTAEMARSHNNANVICIGGRTTSLKTATEILDSFLSKSPPNEERHNRRLEKIKQIEKANFK